MWSSACSLRPATLPYYPICLSSSLVSKVFQWPLTSHRWTKVSPTVNESWFCNPWEVYVIQSGAVCTYCETGCRNSTELCGETPGACSKQAKIRNNWCFHDWAHCPLGRRHTCFVVKARHVFAIFRLMAVLLNALKTISTSQLWLPPLCLRMRSSLVVRQHDVQSIHTLGLELFFAMDVQLFHKPKRREHTPSCDDLQFPARICCFLQRSALSRCLICGEAPNSCLFWRKSAVICEKLLFHDVVISRERGESTWKSVVWGWACVS